MDKNIVLMYGCPITDWQPKIDDDSISEIIKKFTTKDINYFKNKFEELFEEMETELGECKSLTMKRSDDFITTEIKFKNKE